MRPILYVISRTVKNEIIDTVRHPLKFLLYGFIIVSMIYGAVLGFTMNTEEMADGQLSDMRLLSGGYLAVLFFISIPIMRKGLSEGTSFFSLSDVNNIFTAPISERTVLMYGVGRQLAAMIIFLLTFTAYGGMLINMFHLKVYQMLLMLMGILIMLVMVQLVTLMIFCLVSNNPVRVRLIRFIIYAMIIVPIGTVTVYVFAAGIGYDSICDAISLKELEYIPFIGWLHGLVFGLLDGNMQRIFLYGGLLLALAVMCIVTFFTTHPDYYEDVLSKAENHHEFREALREGNVSDKIMMGSRRVKLRKTGISRGSGAATIFFKHMVEGHRRSRFIFFNINTIVLLFTGFVIGFGILQAMPDIDRTIIYLSVSIILAYIQFFFSAASDWVKELTKPYIYLIPDGAVKKLMAAAATGLIKPYTDGLITFCLMGIVLGGHPADIIVCALCYGSFGSVYISANILAQRLVGLDSSGGVFITFYMSVILLTLIPGAAAGLLTLSLFAETLSSIAASLLMGPMLIWNIVITLIIFFLCRNLLDNN